MPSHEVDTALVRHRDRFLLHGGEPTGVRAEILQSWRRSATLSISPDGFSPLYQPDEVDSEGRLLRAADPVIRHLTSNSGELGLGFLVTDDDARILARWTDSSAMVSLLDKVSADRGHVFSEDTIGTNGLGTAIEMGRVVRVDGREHFADILGEFTCVGVPIRDPLTQRMIGVLDITCAADHDNKLITLLATQTAQMIEEGLYEQQSPREQALLRHFLAARRTAAGVVVVSERLMLADPRAGRLLNGLDQALLWEHASRALAVGHRVVEQLETPEGHALITTMAAINEGGDVLGVVIHLRRHERPAAKDLSPLPHLLDQRASGLIGNSSQLRAAFRACQEASARGVVLLTGEHGVGKAAIAQSVHQVSTPRHLHICDCVDIDNDGVLAWYEALRSALAHDPGSLLLQHIEHLPIPECRRVGGLLRAAYSRGWRVMMTSISTRLPASQKTMEWTGAIEVLVPPLRDRINDVLALAEHFAGDRQMSPEVMQVLTRLLWPGNVRELQATIARIVSTGSFRSTVRLADIPSDLATSASRRELTRFERAEINTLLHALSESNGNKTEAARLAGVSRSTFYRKLRAGGIDLENSAF